MGEARVGLFAALPLSLVGAPSVYADAGRRWTVLRSLVYLHLVVMLAWLPLTWQARRALDHYADTVAAEGLRSFPMILIQGGRLHTDVDTPYVWSEPASQEPWLVLDTSGQVSSLQGRPETVLVIPGAVEVAEEGEVHRFDTSEVPALLIDAELLADLLESLRRWFPFLYYPLAVVGSVTSRGLLACLCAGAAALWSRSRRPLDVAGAFGLGTLAITPTLALLLVERLADVTAPGGAGVLLALGYALWGARVTQLAETSDSGP